MFDSKESIKHESFWQILFSRVSWRGHKFYWSELEQDHFISMEVKNSTIYRELTWDRYFPDPVPLISLRMTSSQFAEMITSMNYWTWVPCTIEYVQWKKMEEIPEKEELKSFIHRKFQGRMESFADSIREKQKAAKKLVSKKTLSKEDMRTLQFHLDWLTSEIERNIPFFAKCFQETTNDIVVEAKAEVENAILHKVQALWLEQLHVQNNLLKSESVR